MLTWLDRAHPRVRLRGGSAAHAGHFMPGTTIAALIPSMSPRSYNPHTPTWLSRQMTYRRIMLACTSRRDRRVGGPSSSTQNTISGPPAGVVSSQDIA